jgi:sugar lactone lactonase YvrE
MKRSIRTLVLVGAAVALTRSVHQRQLGLTAFNLQRRVRFILLLLLVACGWSGLSTSLVAAAPGKAARPAYTVKVLARGAPIHGANGLAFNADDRLFVASVMGPEIVVLDPHNGRILERYGPDAGVQNPDDLAFGPDGSLYWTDLGTGEVGRRTPEGTVTKQFVGMGVNPIAFSEDGRLFVAQAFFGDGLYELDPDLEDPPIAIIADTGMPPFPTQLNGMDFGPDGRLYAPQPWMGQIVAIDVDDASVTLVAEGLPAPSAVDFDSQGNLYAAMNLTGDIARIDLATGEFTVIAKVPPAVDNMAFDSADHLFVSQAESGAVYEILPSGHPRVVSPGGLILPGGVAVVPDCHAGESVYVADLWTLVRIDGLSGKVEDIDRQSYRGGLIAPVSAAADGPNIIVTSFLQPGVQVWDPVTDTVLEFHHEFVAPLNAIRFQGDLVVCDLGTGSVIRRDADTGQQTILAAAGFAIPLGLAATDDDLWIGDWITGIIWQVIADGEVLDPPYLVTSGLAQPEGIAVDVDGSLLVVEAGMGQLTRVDPATGIKSVVAGDLALGAPAPGGLPPTWMLNGVAVGGSGDIYVTGDLGSVVYRLRRTGK